MIDIEQVIAPLLKQIEAKQTELSQLKKAVNQVCIAMKAAPKFTDEESTPAFFTHTIRPDEFFGQPFAASVRKILQMKGFAMTAKEIEAKLTEGGFEFPTDWKDNQLRSLAITLAKNSNLIVTLKKGNVTYFGLREFYPTKLKAVEKKKNISSQSEPDTETQENENQDLPENQMPDSDAGEVSE
ncbi:MAG TPA: hypothetical protein PLT92_06075 [Ignavibacteriaceae bacterium]|jgi:hypothetical protein|nr:hypothetical protein [Ignavibacteriaceae bacterium]HOJ18111.1 hypothetical protein [Ignavibacteriaceae bacterium]HPO57192.1 hypothetical protein [Ignavibacteriaceae bacterium]